MLARLSSISSLVYFIDQNGGITNNFFGVLSSSDSYTYYNFEIYATSSEIGLIGYSQATSSSLHTPVFTKLATTGSVALAKRYTSTFTPLQSSYGVQIVGDGSGNWYIVNNIANQDSSMNLNDEFFKVDSSGNIVWSYKPTTGTTYDNYIYDIHVDGNLVTTVGSAVNITTSQPYSYISQFNTSTNTIVFRKSWYTTPITTISGIVRSKDRALRVVSNGTNYFALSETNTPGQYKSNPGYSLSGYLIRCYSSTGNTVFSTGVQDEGWGGVNQNIRIINQLNDLTVGGNNNIFAGGMTNTLSGSTVTRYGSLLSFSSVTGAINWQKRLSIANTQLIDVQTVDGKNYALFDNYPYYYSCYIIEFTDNGDLVWARKLSTPSGTISSTDIQVVDGHIIVTGNISNKPFVLKLPNDGTILGTGTYTSDGISITYSNQVLSLVTTTKTIYDYSSVGVTGGPSSMTYQNSTHTTTAMTVVNTKQDI